jgi:hypothetical protein
MTRQKKEIIKKIEALRIGIEIDRELGCGFAPEGAYDEAYKEIHRLEDELARLMHYECEQDMFFDFRACGAEKFPFA